MSVRCWKWGKWRMTGDGDFSKGMLGDIGGRVVLAGKT